MTAATYPRLLVLVMLLAVSADCALAGEKLRLASGPNETPRHDVGSALFSLMKVKHLPDETIDLQPLSSGGAIDDVRLLRAGDADLAILPSAIGHAARLGIGSFAGEAPATGFRAIASLWRDALHLVVRADDVETGTIDDLSRLKDRTLFLGDASTGVIDANRLLLSDLGIDADHSVGLETLNDGDGIAAIKRGDIDAFSVTAAPPDTLFKDVFRSPPAELRFLNINETQMTRANSNHWLWTPYVIPSETYPGQSLDISTIALSNLLVVRAEIDPDVIYALTKSVFENLAYLKRVDPTLANLSLESALAGMALPLHPGALRYYREAGAIPNPIPSDTPSPPGLTPVRQGDGDPRGIPAERYPDDNVASEGGAGKWIASNGRNGTGGPYVLTPADDAEIGPLDWHAEAMSGRSHRVWWTSTSHWRRRATL